MGRTVTIAFVIGSLLAVPALCVGGVIVHSCESRMEVACCPSPCDCDNHSGCGHENECSDDPCSVFVLRPEHQCGDAVVAQLSVSSAIVGVVATQPSIPIKRTDVYRWPVGKNRPRPLCDLPLLI